MNHDLPTAPSLCCARRRALRGDASEAACRSLFQRTGGGSGLNSRFRVRLLATAAWLAIIIVLPSVDCPAQTDQQTIPPAATGSVGFVRIESVLDRMREFKGEKTREALSALFVRMDSAFSQEPSILLADGSATARVTLRVPYRKGEAPTFSISGGRCVTARATDNNIWILDIMPARGSMSTSVTVLSGGSMTEYPLTVAPPLNLLDPRSADLVEIEYAVLANELAAAHATSGQK